MTIAQNVINWARGKAGKTVGAGECWDLVDSALKAGGAHGSEHFGTIGDDVDYIWGDPVALNAVQAGDVIQTRDHVVTTTVVTRTIYPDGQEGRDETESTEERPHHSAIVTSLLDKNGTVASLEQNVEPKGKVVQTKRLNTRDVPTITTKKSGYAVDPRTDKKVAVKIITETTITVTGMVNVFRPVKR